LPGPAHHRGDPGPEFARPEGLDEVIVCAALQRHDRVELLIPAREHDHVGVTELPDPTQYLVAIDVRETDIKGDYIRTALFGKIHAVAARSRGVHFEPCLAQDGVEETAHVVIIFNYYGNTKIAHSCPSNRQYHRIAQRNAGSTSRLPTVQRG
jgi:hypothetical protein